MKRTPRSASRRAVKQLAAKEPSAPRVPYRSRVRCDSLVKSQTGDGGLHAERHLVLRNPRGNLGIVDHTVVHAVELLHGVDDVALPLFGNASRPRQVEDRLAGRAQMDPLKAA